MLDRTKHAPISTMQLQPELAHEPARARKLTNFDNKMHRLESIWLIRLVQSSNRELPTSHSMIEYEAEQVANSCEKFFHTAW